MHNCVQRKLFPDIFAHFKIFIQRELRENRDTCMDQNPYQAMTCRSPEAPHAMTGHDRAWHGMEHALCMYQTQNYKSADPTNPSPTDPTPPC